MLSNGPVTTAANWMPVRQAGRWAMGDGRWAMGDGRRALSSWAKRRIYCP